MGWGRQGDVVYLPKMRTQIVAARAVAEALADLALSRPSRKPSAGEIAGPREEYLPDLAELLAAKRGDGVKIEAVSNPADPNDVLNNNGGLLPGPHATLAGPTFAEWLDAQLITPVAVTRPAASRHEVRTASPSGAADTTSPCPSYNGDTSR